MGQFSQAELGYFSRAPKRQFVDLLHRTLVYLQFPSRGVVGTAIYYGDGREIFRWQHAGSDW
jgi:hypothetical protein